MQVTSEYLQFDDEDQANSNSHSRISPYGAAEDAYNNRIYYCYYEPSKMLYIAVITRVVRNTSGLVFRSVFSSFLSLGVRFSKPLEICILFPIKW